MLLLLSSGVTILILGLAAQSSACTFLQGVVLLRCSNFLQRSGSCVVRTFACSHHKGNTVYRLLVVPRVQVLGCQGLTEQPPSLSAGRCSLPLRGQTCFSCEVLAVAMSGLRRAPWLATSLHPFVHGPAALVLHLVQQSHIPAFGRVCVTSVEVQFPLACGSA